MERPTAATPETLYKSTFKIEYRELVKRNYYPNYKPTVMESVQTVMQNSGWKRDRYDGINQAKLDSARTLTEQVFSDSLFPETDDFQGTGTDRRFSRIIGIDRQNNNQQPYVELSYDWQYQSSAYSQPPHPETVWACAADYEGLKTAEALMEESLPLLAACVVQSSEELASYMKRTPHWLSLSHTIYQQPNRTSELESLIAGRGGISPGTAVRAYEDLVLAKRPIDILLRYLESEREPLYRTPSILDRYWGQLGFAEAPDKSPMTSGWSLGDSLRLNLFRLMRGHVMWEFLADEGKKVRNSEELKNDFLFEKQTNPFDLLLRIYNLGYLPLGISGKHFYLGIRDLPSRFVTSDEK